MSRIEVLQALVAGTISPEEADQLIAALNPIKVKPLKVLAKENGMVAVKGLQKFQVKFYKDQWVRLNDFMPEVIAFIKANDSLPNKPIAA